VDALHKEKKRQFESSSRGLAPQRPHAHVLPLPRSRYTQGAVTALSHGGGTYIANYHRPAQSHPTLGHPTQGTGTWRTATPTTTGSTPFTCFGCGQPGHKIAECLIKNGTPPASTQARQTTTPAAPHKNVLGAVCCRLNHMTAEDAQDAPDVVYGMFLVQGVIASVLFNSGATCSYISTKFAREHSVPMTPYKEPIDTSSLLGCIICTKRCQGVSITIEGYPFLADLTLLPGM
jgi:Pyruvate/2-oxoacid:ferredoxin oxidoreductase delta subunit